jgi:hypothetical protein
LEYSRFLLIFAHGIFTKPEINMEITKKKRTREEVRAAFREYLTDKKKRMEEKQRELEEIHEMRMSGMTMEEIFA